MCALPILDDAQFRIAVFDLAECRRYAPAIGAVVIEELDQAHITLRIPADRACRVVEDLVAACRDNLSNLIELSRALPLLHALKGFDENLRILVRKSTRLNSSH